MSADEAPRMLGNVWRSMLALGGADHHLGRTDTGMAWQNWRGLATRDDKLALTYRAAAVLAAICTWLRHLRDTP